MGYRDLHAVICYLLLLCTVTVPFSYGLELLRQEYTDALSIFDEPRPVNRYLRSTNPVSRRKQDNHKPELQCPDNVTVLEEQPIQTFVTTIKAADSDGDQITFTFQQTKKHDFLIDEKTGRITTAAIFDRDDASSRQKEMYVTVIATDDGYPKLFDVCTFKIVILDINDNPPIFDKSSYEVSIPSDHLVGQPVMNIYATDSDAGNNSVIVYSLIPNTGDVNYFSIDESTGVISLQKPLNNEMEKRTIKLTAEARDAGQVPLKTDISLHIKIVSSKKKAPRFLDAFDKTITLSEDYVDYVTPLMTLEVDSNLEDKTVQFFLQQGRTLETNKDGTFRINTTTNVVSIVLGRNLDYESVTEYNLRLSVRNGDDLSAFKQITVKITDVNDNIPTFTSLFSDSSRTSGSVSENEPPNTVVMTVQATDKDGTSPNNEVSYELADYTDYFQIDPKTGVIRTKVELDRETISVFGVKVKVKDGAPSSLYHDSRPNEAEQVFRIEVDDKNDNPPRFESSTYVVNQVAESTDENKIIIEVKAKDLDTASTITYAIIEGDETNDFFIDKSGKILVKHKLDYETKPNYVLIIMADDGKFNDTAEVRISLKNENDEPPIFHNFDKNVRIKEEEIPENCLVHVLAIDPDRKNKSEGIIYTVTSSHNSIQFLTVEKDGCVRLTKELDRDPPNGLERWQALVTAIDDDGAAGSLSTAESFFIILEDINDNAPTLIHKEVVWQENKDIDHGSILKLEAEDNDTEQNGPPFSYALSENAPDDIKKKFTVRDGNLDPLVKFDRERQKEYLVAISITDSGKPPLTGESILKVIIGDENDHPMKPGQSRILVNVRSNMPNTLIGRVYVDDPDDWDLPFKTFRWKNTLYTDKFKLNEDTGGLTIIGSTEPGEYLLEFSVTEKSPYFSEHSVDANVTVFVKLIPEEAISKSGSFRLINHNAEKFITSINPGTKSNKEMIERELAKTANVSLQNLDIVSILQSNSGKPEEYLDIRYAAHGSPYHFPEELNTLMTLEQDELTFVESLYMVHIAECLNESVCLGYSCTNYLNISDNPYVISTNQTSFVGVSAVVEPRCGCSYEFETRHYCLNGGTPLEDVLCHCEPGFNGPHCEALSVSFIGNGFAMYEPFETCNSSLITLEIVTTQKNGLIFYIGPLRNNKRYPVNRDFMSLELKDGYPVLLLDYGNGTAYVRQNYTMLSDGRTHTISVDFNTERVVLNVDNCVSSECFSMGLKDIPLPGRALNVNGPLQVGGFILDMQGTGKNTLEQLATEMKWDYKPTSVGFIGCINNLTYNRHTYNLGQPNYGKNYFKDCNMEGPQAAAFGIDSNFLVALLVCLAILLILLLAVVVHRKQQDNYNEKELDDIRETIINYEDEGGGEVDTGFDLELLRRESHFDEPYIKKHDMFYTRAPDDVPDINGFLKGKKDACDKDPDFNPFDDVRYYAYEGDGNTSRSSLSSLASCTDEGDLKFAYLSNFGPRFRKLADMYGEEPSDDEDNDGGEESWC